MFRGEWALNINNVDHYALVLQNILETKEINLQPNAFEPMIFDRQGNAYKSNLEDDDKDPIKTNSKAVFRIEGEIVKASGLCHTGAMEMAHHINMAAKHKNVEGLVLILDTPGGQVSAAHPIVSAINNAKKNGKPVIALVENAMSLGYWIASQADQIILKDDIAGMVGSIGVLLSFVDATKHLEEKGIKIHTITPPESKHKVEAFKLAIEGKYDKINDELLSPMAIKFQETVRAARGSKLKEEVGVLTGKTFFADKALEYGLIDKVGSLEDAFQMIEILKEIKQL